jgi:hypothetical protein
MLTVAGSGGLRLERWSELRAVLLRFGDGRGWWGPAGGSWGLQGWLGFAGWSWEMSGDFAFA